MEQVITEYRLTRLGRVRLAFIASSAFLVLTAFLLYGSLWTALLLLAGLLAYSCTAFLCYHPEGRPWREEVDKLYEALFHLLLRRARQSDGLSSGRLKRVEGGAQVSQLCHKEAQKFIQLILRDFVVEWYEKFTDDPEFPEDIQKILEHVALETSRRLQNIDLDSAVTELLSLLLPYLEVGQDAGTLNYDGVKVFDVNHEKCLRAFESNTRVSQRVLRSPEAEANFCRQLVDILLQSTLPPEYRNCDATCLFLREVLVTNIVAPLVDLLSDPDFLNDAIPIALSKASQEKVDRELAEIRRENEQLEVELSREKLRMMHQPTQTQRRRFSTSLYTTRHTQSDLVKLHRATALFDSVVASASTASLPSDSNTAGKRPRSATVDVSFSPKTPSGHLMPENDVARPGRTSSSASSDSEGSGIVCVQLPPIFVTRHVRVNKDNDLHIGYIFKVSTSWV